MSTHVPGVQPFFSLYWPYMLATSSVRVKKQGAWTSFGHPNTYRSHQRIPSFKRNLSEIAILMNNLITEYFSSISFLRHYIRILYLLSISKNICMVVICINRVFIESRAPNLYNFQFWAPNFYILANILVE